MSELDYSNECQWEEDQTDGLPGQAPIKSSWCVTHDSAHLDNETKMPPANAPTLHPVFAQIFDDFGMGAR